MSKKSTKSLLVLALVAALALVLVLSNVSFADGETPTSGATTCVSGYVINHREQAVDGTKFDPQLQVGLMSAASLEDATAGNYTVLDSADVDENGNYVFEDLAADMYYNFTMTMPMDWDGIVPQAERNGVGYTGWTMLGESDDCHDVVFKIRRWYDVTVRKWEENRAGTVAGGAGWKISATPVGDPFAVAKKGTTDADGYVQFQLTPGKWSIKETLKDGWTPITPTEVVINLDQYGAAGATDLVMFKNLEPVCYASVTVYKHGLGTNAKGEQEFLGPLTGWKITLSRPDGTMATQSAMTDGSGKVVFGDLKPGVYKVEETVQPGWEAVTDNPQKFILAACEDKEIVMENLEVAGHLKISGTKYFQAWVEPYVGKSVGLSGWVITATLKDAEPAVAITTVTDALGQYAFSEADLQDGGLALPGATITVCEEKRDHWIPVSPTCVDVLLPYPVPMTYTGTVVNFTNMQDPPPGTAMGASYAGAASACAMPYTVQAGDNLSSIAAANGLSMSAVMQANGLANANYIQAGQVLCLR
ncbi:MAG: SpaA isopeptide-forming pilin-related protein [Caldilineales bacterium]